MRDGQIGENLEHPVIGGPPCSVPTLGRHPGQPVGIGVRKKGAVPAKAKIMGPFGSGVPAFSERAGMDDRPVIVLDIRVEAEAPIRFDTPRHESRRHRRGGDRRQDIEAFAEIEAQ